MNPTIKIINLVNDEIIEREMNAQELAQWEADVSEAEAKAEAAAKALEAKAAILEKLGITEDEAKLLLG